MRGSQNKFKKYEKVNTRFPADPWKMRLAGKLGVGEWEWGMESEHQLFFLRHLLKR